MITVGIIGAGASGLCALRHALQTEGMSPIVWERSRNIGGTWVYSDISGVDEFGIPIHSSMYNSLRTDLPKEIMAFPDFPFQSDGDSFVPHSKMREYLEQYASHFQLKQHIKLCSSVEEVVPLSPGSTNTDWQVAVRDLMTGKVSTSVCNIVIICNGHFSVPFMPPIPGLDKFSGCVDHSHYYRVPDSYANKTVVVLGASASGRDISLELSAVAKKVYLSHNLSLPLLSALPSNVMEVAGVKELKEKSDDTFVLRDGKEIKADAFLYCTGYQYSFPFLSSSCGIEVSDNQVKPLYRHIINCKHPSMGFIGIPFHMIPFPFFDLQVRYYMLTVTGKIQTPTPEQMADHVTKDLEKRRALGEKPSQYHSLGMKQWEFIDTMEREINQVLGKPHVKQHESQKKNATKETIAAPVNNFPAHVRKIFGITIMRIFFKFNVFKYYNYRLNGNNSAGEVKFTESLDNKTTDPNKEFYGILVRQIPFYVLRNFPSILKVIIISLYYKAKEILFFR